MIEMMLRVFIFVRNMPRVAKNMFLANFYLAKIT